MFVFNRRITVIALAAISALGLVSCTQEQQNKIGREIQNWTGTSGVLEVYAGDKLVRRFIKIDTHMQLTLAIQQGWLINCLKAQLIAGVGGVGHQLAQKDFLVTVERVDHQV